MATTTCYLCREPIEDTGGGVFVLVDSGSYICPVGQQAGVDHVTRSTEGFVSNDDLLTDEKIAALDLDPEDGFDEDCDDCGARSGYDCAPYCIATVGD